MLRFLGNPEKIDYTPAQMYGSMFKMLSDQLYVIREHAQNLYREAIEQGIDPAEMGADFSLVDLDLAELSEVPRIDGEIDVVYLEPESATVVLKNTNSVITGLFTEVGDPA